MPPQQGNRLLDVVGGAFGFGAHVHPCKPPVWRRQVAL
jgi:hypothetical protein